MKNKTYLFGLSFLSSLFIFNFLYKIFYKILIIETEYHPEYRFPNSQWLLKYFYVGYHYEATLLNMIITFVISLFTGYLLINTIWKLFIPNNKI